MKDTVNIEEFMQQNGFFMNVVDGISMYPMLRSKRDIVVIKPYEGRLKKYDVPLYKVNNDYILHRIIKVLPDSYVMRGDNRMDKEYGIKDEDIIGVLTSFHRDKKEICVENKWYCLYSRLWNYIFPIRLLYKKCRGFAGRIKRLASKQIRG
jgi:signal peptidase I